MKAGGAGLLACLLAAVAILLVRSSPGGKGLPNPTSVTELTHAIRVDAGAEIYGTPGSVLRMSPQFHDAAMLELAGDDIYLHDLTLDGNRDAFALRQGLPPYNQPFAGFTPRNGILIAGRRRIVIRNVRFVNMPGFAILASRSADITIDGVHISNSGGRNALGRNNTTGGILIEEGTTDFRVTRSELRNIRGNGIWTHSLYTSPRNAGGLIAENHIFDIGRDAIQVGHATDVRVLDNVGAHIGFPIADVDVEAKAIPVAIDTAGNVDRSQYVNNRFSEINGKCIDLDGFHDGEVRGNACVNRGGPEAYPQGGYGIVMNNTNPDMQSSRIRIVDNLIEGFRFGGVFVIGENNVVTHNRLLNLNTAHCNEEAARFGCYYAPGEPDMLRSGIYLGKGAERPGLARGNLVEDNEITGYKMDSRCIGGAPTIYPGWNTVRNNLCR